VTVQKRYKAINFDLDSGNLRTVFGEKGRRKAYSQIQSFLLDNGFSHKQWSGYASKYPMSYSEIYDVVFNLVDECTWMISCVNQFDATNVMAESDMLDAIQNYNHAQLSLTEFR
jgi:virulence-associated protein VapD